MRISKKHGGHPRTPTSNAAAYVGIFPAILNWRESGMSKIKQFNATGPKQQ
jgi:hypothetical protein